MEASDSAPGHAAVGEPADPVSALPRGEAVEEPSRIDLDEAAEDLSWTSLVPQLPEHLCGGFGDRGLCLELLVADADGDVLQGS